MIKIYPHTLNVYQHVHRLAHWVTETLVDVCPDSFSEVTCIADADCVVTNAPAAPPYTFDIGTAMTVTSANKPVFIFNDADGAPPDCGIHDGMDKAYNFPQFVQGGHNIRAYFYREWFMGYERPDLGFPLVPYELVGVKHWNMPKDTHDYSEGITREQFERRAIDILFGQTCHTQSRVAMRRALSERPRTHVRDLSQERMLGDVWMSKLRDAKITVCLEGGGVKCQCHCEAPIASVMAMPDIAMHETYAWCDGGNCIRLPYLPNKGEGSLVHNYGRGLVDVPAALNKMNDLLRNPGKLWEIMQSGMENARHYSLPNYYRYHLGATIEKYL